MKKYSKYILKGIEQPLNKVYAHGKAPFKRFLMLDKDLLRGARLHVAIHIIKKLPKKIPKYSKCHAHEFDEINLIISEKSKLVYNVHLGNESYELRSPTTIFIPKGTLHSAEAVSGTGIFVCIQIY